MLDGRDSSQLAIPHVRVRDQRLYQTIGLLGRQVRNTLTNSNLPLISILCLFSEFLFYLSFWPKTNRLCLSDYLSLNNFFGVVTEVCNQAEKSFTMRGKGLDTILDLNQPIPATRRPNERQTSGFRVATDPRLGERGKSLRRRDSDRMMRTSRRGRAGEDVNGERKGSLESSM